MAVQQKYRREEVSEVSCCLKYIIFSFNVLFWMFGLSVMAVGVWALTEKNAFNILNKLKHLALDPVFALILIGFTGCIGALRENTSCLLGSIKSQVTEGLQTIIVHYREDPDQQNLIDWILEDWTDDIRKRVDLIINEKECLQSEEEWLERNMLFIATVRLISAFCKILRAYYALLKIYILTYLSKKASGTRILDGILKK